MESQICTKAKGGNFNGDSAFNNVVRAPDVPIYALMAACAKDPSPVKLNLGIGIYRTEDGKPHLLNAVRRAEQLLLDQFTATKEYLPITGSPEFNRLCAGLTFGAESSAIKERRVTTVQSVSASGSLRIGAEFLARHHHQRVVYLSVPTFGNHPNFFRAVGIAVKTYRYYDPKSRELDFQGLLEDLDSAPRGAIVLLQACCHNPTGVDPTVEQWEQIRQLMRLKGLLPFFDSAYLGFASGSLDMDAQPVKMFVADGGECLVAQSFSKNMGLYGERVGALSIVCKTAEVASRVESQLTVVIRSMYLSPPIHGAAIAAMILNDRQLFDEWITELKVMAGRILYLRRELYAALRDRGTPGDWRHIIRQVGLFTFSGLNTEQVSFMTKEYHIYMPSDGRINVAALSSKTVPLLADAIHAAVTCIA